MVAKEKKAVYMGRLRTKDITVVVGSSRQDETAVDAAADRRDIAMRPCFDVPETGKGMIVWEEVLGHYRFRSSTLSLSPRKKG